MQLNLFQGKKTTSLCFKVNVKERKPVYSYNSCKSYVKVNSIFISNFLKTTKIVVSE